MRPGAASRMALGGVLAALALVLMLLGGFIPVMTYVCPLLCLFLEALVCKFCGNRIAWAWYGAVAVLSALMAPDKEAAALLVFLGYYPIGKPRLDRLRPKALAWAVKLTLLSASVAAAYGLLIWLLGMEALVAEFRGIGIALGILLWVMGSACLVGLDLVLSRISAMRR